MLSVLPKPVCGILSLFLYFLNTVFWSIPIFIFAFLKLLIPVKSWRKLCTEILYGMVNNWIGVNNYNHRVFSNIRWDVSGTDALKPQEWYLVVANHQSWVDILVLQKIFYRKIPMLKFFIKKELFWLPILGQAWWALEFPFIKRYSKSFLEKHPHLRGKDIEITREACKKFKTIPVSIMNFVEGTRFTEEKRKKQQSPYVNLLRTKAGGIAHVLAAMGDRLHSILDVTIVYPQRQKGFWSFVCGNIQEIKIRVTSLPVKNEMIGDYAEDMVFRSKFQNWLNALWAEKDSHISKLLAQP